MYVPSDAIGVRLEDKTLPPPPPEGNLEVVIRTLASDFELLQESGGTFSYISRAENIIRVEEGGIQREKATVPRSHENRNQTILWGIIVIVGAVLFFMLGRFVVPSIIGGGVTGEEQQPAGATQTVPVTTTTNNTQPLYLGHKSFFAGSAEPIAIDLYKNGAPPDKASLIRNIIDAMQGTAGSTAFSEITMKSIGGSPITWSAFVRLLGGEELDYEVLREHFVRDYTMFSYRDKLGVWPGYVFKLNEGETPLLLQRDILALESAPQSTRKLFFFDPGEMESKFRDAQISGQPVRMLNVKETANTFAYGWFFGKYLVISTSVDGLKEALARL